MSLHLSGGIHVSTDRRRVLPQSDHRYIRRWQRRRELGGLPGRVSTSCPCPPPDWGTPSPCSTGRPAILSTVGHAPSRRPAVTDSASPRPRCGPKGGAAARLAISDRAAPFFHSRAEPRNSRASLGCSAHLR